MVPRAHYLKNYWHGLHSPSHVVWIDLFALSLMLSVLMDLVPKQLNMFEITLSLLCLNAFFIWQLTGAVRTIQIAVKSRSDIVVIVFLALTVAIVSAVSIWRCIDILYPQTERFETVSLPPISQLDISTDGQTIHLTGDISYPLRASFLSTLENNSDIKTVSLSSSGGAIFAARAIAIKIAELGLNTRVDENCFSACTLIFLAGDQRSLGKAGQLGFHSYATESMITSATLNIQEQIDRDKNYLISRGVSKSFVEEAYGTPHDEIWIPNKLELSNAGVLVPSF